MAVRERDFLAISSALSDEREKLRGSAEEHGSAEEREACEICAEFLDNPDAQDALLASRMSMNKYELGHVVVNAYYRNMDVFYKIMRVVLSDLREGDLGEPDLRYLDEE